MKARDVMTANVISVRPETSVQEIAGLLIELRIGAVPVVEAEGRLAGMVSQGDLLHLFEAEGGDQRPWYQRLLATPEERARDYLRSHARTARELMTSPVITVEPSTPVVDIAHLLEARGIRSVPVVEAGRLIGIVSRGDLLRALALNRVAAAVSTDERELRERVAKRFSQAGLDWRHYVSVAVADGKVHLWGLVGSVEDAELFKRLAEEVTGEGGVESHLGVRETEAQLRPGRHYMA